METFLARTRNLKPGFFTNERLADLQPLTRLLYQGLWIHADKEGRLEDRPRRLKIEILPYDDCDVNSMLSELAEMGFIQRYSVDARAFIQIPTFRDHQNPHPKETKSVIPPPCNSTAEPCKAILGEGRLGEGRKRRSREKEDPECKEEEGGELMPNWMAGFYEKFREGWNGIYPGQDYKDTHNRHDFVYLARIQNNKALTPENWKIACRHYFETPQDVHTMADLSKRYSTFLAHALDRYKKPVRGNGLMTDRESRTIQAANRVIEGLQSGQFDPSKRS